MSPRKRSSPLKEYAKKRDFSRTPEPEGEAGARPGSLYVIQKHDASRLHYDLRLQVDGVLASWAVPKGPSLDPSDKRLAVHVEDHPVSYAEFEGTIPKGEYGGGTVLVWDRGVWTPEDDDPAEAIRRGKLSFRLDGERLRGGWTLTRMGGQKAGHDGHDNWLLIKRDDEAASRNGSVVEEHPESVKTGRSLKEIARANGSAEKESSPVRVRKTAKKTTRKREPAAARAGVRRPMAEEYTPQLCTLTTETPPGDLWVHEIKYDGYRLLARREGSLTRLITRGRKDWTARFQPIADAIGDLPVKSAVLDGEATILGPDGQSSFQRLQQAMKAGDFDDLVFFAFDLLYLDGVDLTPAPLGERKELLRRLLPEGSEGLLRYSEHVHGEGLQVHREACRLGLEGIVSKRVDAPYVQERAATWVKVKCSRRQEFVVIGWTDPAGSREHFGALLLGAHTPDGSLAYTGRVGTGFDSDMLAQVKRRLRPLARKTCPADPAPTVAERRGAHWVSPELVVEVEFTQWTDDARLRHPSFKGIREDKPAQEVRVEAPTPLEELDTTPGVAARPAQGRKTMGRRAKRAPAKAVTVAGVTISSGDRVLFPDEGLTKADLAAYYEKVAEVMLPHLQGRPLSVVRCPEGRARNCFFQKHFGDTFSDPVKPIRVPEKNGEADYLSVDSPAGLVTLVQFGVLEIHPWGATETDLEKPDLLTFDLDPGPGTPWPAVRHAAVRVREHLERVDLACFLKTTGGKGLHVVVPLKPDASWDDAKAFCAAIAKRMAREEPELYVAVSDKSRRPGRVFVDYLRNSRGATSVAPFSTRARAGGPVATPLRWDELARVEGGNQYDTAAVLRRLSGLRKDPWSGYFGTRQRLTTARRAAASAAERSK